MLLSGEDDEMSDQLRYVLRGYESLRDFDYAELQLVEALRTLRLLHHAAWLARRWDDPAFPAARRASDALASSSARSGVSVI